MSQDLGAQVAQIGRAVVQVNLRLSRVLELLEAGGGAKETGGDDLEILLDLLDALTLSLAPARTRGWLDRLRPDPDLDLRRGLALARAAALERLRAQGVEPAPTDGAFDAAIHQVVERVRARDPGQHHTIARVIRPGWVAQKDGARAVIRPAMVAVYAVEEG